MQTRRTRNAKQPLKICKLQGKTRGREKKPLCRHFLPFFPPRENSSEPVWTNLLPIFFFFLCFFFLFSFVARLLFGFAATSTSELHASVGWTDRFSRGENYRRTRWKFVDALFCEGVCTLAFVGMVGPQQLPCLGVLAISPAERTFC